MGSCVPPAAFDYPHPSQPQTPPMLDRMGGVWIVEMGGIEPPSEMV
jgi:hypothetical protein